MNNFKENSQYGGNLERLSQSSLMLGTNAEDIRGCKVYDSSGQEIGKVDDLIVDESERKVRFLQVGSGGFLGIGREHFLMPIESVESVGDNMVRVNQSSDRIAQSPEYNPDLKLDRDQYGSHYDYYGYLPYWSNATTIGAPVPVTPAEIDARDRDFPPRKD
jgi:sporulation protein YlmC with PRC-barrel domain